MYVIIGASGYLGSNLIASLLSDSNNESIIAVARQVPANDTRNRMRWYACDITDKIQVDMFADFLDQWDECKKVAFLSACHHPDSVEADPRFAWHVNVTSLSYCINRINNIFNLIYPSTDSVYGESKNGYHYKENDPLAPVNTYGRQKVVAENIVTGYGFHVLRYPFLIGPSMTNKKHFYDEIVAKLMDQQVVEMFSDSYRSTLDFKSASRYMNVALDMESTNLPKIMNICGDDDLSKFDVGLRIAKKLGFDENLIRPISINDSAGIFQARRASSTLMDNSLMKSVFNVSSVKLLI